MPTITVRRLLVSLAAIGAFLWTPAAGGRSVAVAAPSAAEVECVALNIYHEARGETVVGKLAVGHVVLNRMQDRRFPDRACAVVRQGGEKRRYRCQFTWWCDGRSDRPRDAQAWRQALDLANHIYAGMSVDPTGGALWYHADYVKPRWRKQLARGPMIGRHIFYGGTGSTGTQIASVHAAHVITLLGRRVGATEASAEADGMTIASLRSQDLSARVNRFISGLFERGTPEL